MNKGYTLIKTWRKNGFSLRLYDTYEISDYGKRKLAYTFRDSGKIIFEGEDFYVPRGYVLDSLVTVYSLLGFLSVKDGDTDSEYFDKYTPEQINWRDSDRCEELSWIVSEWEEKNHAW